MARRCSHPQSPRARPGLRFPPASPPWRARRRRACAARVALAADGRAAMSRDTNFYYSFLVLPPAKRRAIVAVWDFCRAVDDAADEPAGSSPELALAKWRRELAACFEGGAAATPQAAALAPV